jgi:hypothetical protein
MSMEKKIKYSLEYGFNSPPKVLYSRISTVAGLSEWFADNVMVNGDNFIFVWDDSEQEAKLLGKKDLSYAKFKWVDDEDDKSYFEFRIEIDGITGDVALIITDFAYEDEKEDDIDLWEAQIDSLRGVIGS